MTIYIRNSEADRLARELAARMGKPVEEALLDILREKAEQGAGLPVSEQKDPTWEDIQEIIRHFSTLPVYDTRTPDEIIGYDENGMP